MKTLIICAAILLACSPTLWAGAGDAYDIRIHPEAIISDVDHAKLNIGGIKIGDDVASIPANQVVDHSGDGVVIFLKDGYQAIIANGKVKELGWDSANKSGWTKIKIETNDDIELVLGKADRIGDETHNKQYKSYIFGSVGEFMGSLSLKAACCREGWARRRFVGDGAGGAALALRRRTAEYRRQRR